MPNRSSLAVRCGATFLLVMFAAACGSGTANAPAGAQGSAGAQSATGAVVAGATAPGQAQGQQGGSAGSIEDGLGHPVNVCSLLPAATAASISGEAISQATEDDTTSYKLYVCKYSNAAGTNGFDISVLALDAAAGYDAGLTAAGSDAKQISGLGDKAFSSILGLKALFGNVSITVSNLASDDASEALIRELQPKL
jgi:hypothetical protein